MFVQRCYILWISKKQI